ncbi:MAG: hypothetical protein ACLVHV_01920 [Oscillospiraceae bacterium]
MPQAGGLQTPQSPGSQVDGDFGCPSQPSLRSQQAGGGSRPGVPGHHEASGMSPMFLEDAPTT